MNFLFNFCRSLSPSLLLRFAFVGGNFLLFFKIDEKKMRKKRKKKKLILLTRLWRIPRWVRRCWYAQTPTANYLRHVKWSLNRSLDANVKRPRRMRAESKFFVFIADWFATRKPTADSISLHRLETFAYLHLQSMPAEIERPDRTGGTAACWEEFLRMCTVHVRIAEYRTFPNENETKQQQQQQKRSSERNWKLAHIMHNYKIIIVLFMFRLYKS